ncbi:MAG: hypothetical protein JSR97_09775 [Verrucomicrobia bacterium]|nr:hypothetical protein [Verrucomicrobiota bacterium]
MAVKPLNNSLKKDFEKLFQKATARAISDFQVNIEQKLKNQDHYNSLKLLIEESKRLDELIDNHPHPYYIENHSSEDWLLTQFASRTILLNVDESKELSEAVYLGKYRALISEKKWPMKDEIPGYTYQDFVNGKECQYFLSFDNYYNISEEDYYKIRDWQSANLIKIVGYEYRMLIANIQAHCKTLSNPLEFIIAEKEKLENELDKTPDDPTLLKNVLDKLFIFKGVNLNKFNDELLIRNFKPYKTGEIDWKCISPANIEAPLKKLQKKPKTIFSSESTIFYTINKITDWLDSVIKGKPIQEPVIETDWQVILANAQNNALLQVEQLTTEIDEHVYQPDLSNEEIKEYLIEHLETYRRKFNAFEEKYFFHILRDEKKHLLERMFITNSFLSNDMERQIQAVIESTIIYEVSWHVVQTYCAIFDTHKIDFPGRNDGYLQIMSLMNQMVIEKDLYNEMRDSMDDFMQHFHSYFLPIEIHFQNQREKFTELFDKSLDRLQDSLDEADPTNKIIYLQSRLKELRQSENRIKRHKHESWFDKREFKYAKLFKEFLQIEADFIRETKDIELPPLLKAPSPYLLPDSQPQNFESLVSEEKAAFIMKMLEDLSITLNGKSQLSERRKGALRGIVEALKEKDILPNRSLETLNKLFADKIGLTLKSKIDWSKTSDLYLDKGKKYISENYN